MPEKVEDNRQSAISGIRVHPVKSITYPGDIVIVGFFFSAVSGGLSRDSVMPTISVYQSLPVGGKRHLKDYTLAPIPSKPGTYFYRNWFRESGQYELVLLPEDSGFGRVAASITICPPQLFRAWAYNLISEGHRLKELDDSLRSVYDARQVDQSLPAGGFRSAMGRCVKEATKSLSEIGGLFEVEIGDGHSWEIKPAMASMVIPPIVFVLSLAADVIFPEGRFDFVVKERRLGHVAIEIGFQPVSEGYEWLAYDFQKDLVRELYPNISVEYMGAQRNRAALMIEVSGVLGDFLFSV